MSDQTPVVLRPRVWPRNRRRWWASFCSCSLWRSQASLSGCGEDPRAIGSVWNGENKPPEGNSDGKNDRRLIRSRKRHELRFDDGEANEIELAMRDGSRVHLADGRAVLEDRQGNKVEIRDGNITVKAAQKVTVKGPRIVIEASGQLELKAGGTCKIQGAMVEIN